jgi:hypothetical protein
MNNFIIPQSEKYINPNKVNTVKFITIFSNDPRNNSNFLGKNPFTVVIDAIENISNVIQTDDLYNSDPDMPIAPSKPIDSDPNTDNPDSPELLAPTNLSVTNFELKLGTDGTAYYIATIKFDDVPGAEIYEATLEIVT